jgi:hypothetical protein
VKHFNLGLARLYGKKLGKVMHIDSSFATMVADSQKEAVENFKKYLGLGFKDDDMIWIAVTRLEPNKLGVLQTKGMTAFYHYHRMTLDKRKKP